MSRQPPIDRVLVHLSDYRRVPINPGKIYLLEAAGDDTIIRTRGKRTMRDVRKLGELTRIFHELGHQNKFRYPRM